MKKIILALLIVVTINSNAQNVGIGTTTPDTKLTINTGAGSAFGLSHTNGTVTVKTFVSSSMGQIGTFSNHPFQLMANDLNGQFVLMPNGLIGIANAAPSLAGLTVDKAVGAVNALFGSTTTGVAIESSFPGIGFNSYYNAGRKFIGSGFGGVLGYNPTNGYFTFASSTITGTANAAATTPSSLTITPQGFVGIGTPTPAANLDINGNLFLNGLLKLTNGNADGTYLAGSANGYTSWKPTSAFAHLTTATNSYGFTQTDGAATLATYIGKPAGFVEFDGGWIGTETSSPLYFFTDGASTTATPAMTINTFDGPNKFQFNGGISLTCNYTTASTNNIGISADAENNAQENLGVYGTASGPDGATSIGVMGFAAGNTDYGVYGIATIGAPVSWAGYFEGNVFSTGTFQTSDERLKTNIVSYEDNAVNTLKKFTVKRYTFRQDGDYAKMNMTTDPQVGIMAADIKNVYPQLVKKAVSQVMDEKTHKPTGKTIEFDAVNYTGLIPVLVKGMQEQQQQIEELKAEVEALKALLKK